MEVYLTAHATTIDNENGIASGWNDAELSELGRQQARRLRERLGGRKVDLICCSDLARAVDTVRLGFADELPIVVDRRLRETNYGDLNGKLVEAADLANKRWIEGPFPGGESYAQAVVRNQEFFTELRKSHPHKAVLVIGHRATRFAPETSRGGRTLADCLDTPFTWQPYWAYEL